MINGAHAILYSDDAAATRATLAKVLGTRTVDAGGGWHQHRVRIAEVLKEVVPDVVADCVGIPDRTGEQVLRGLLRCANLRRAEGSAHLQIRLRPRARRRRPPLAGSLAPRRPTRSGLAEDSGRSHAQR
jgi:hypothetical protein